MDAELSNIFVCNKCRGRNFLDRSSLKDDKIDLICVNCGHGTYIDRKSPNGVAIIKMELARALALGVSWEVYTIGDKERIKDFN